MKRFLWFSLLLLVLGGVGVWAFWSSPSSVRVLNPVEEVAHQAKWSLRFSGEVDPFSLEQKVRFLPEIEGSWVWEDHHRTLRFVPEGSFVEGKEYLLVVDKGGKDSWGRLLPKVRPRQVYFTPKLPTITHQSPRPGDTIGGEEPFVLLWDRPLLWVEEEQDLDLQSFFRITPDIAGTWEMLGRHGLLFTPEESWLGGNRYEISISETLLGKPFVAEYKTDPLQVVRVEEVDLFGQNPLRIHFNQPFVLEDMWLMSLDPALHFRPQYGYQKVPQELQEEAVIVPPDYRVLEIIPRGQWLPDKTYTLSIPKGVRSRLGPLGLQDSYEYIFQTAPKKVLPEEPVIEDDKAPPPTSSSDPELKAASPFWVEASLPKHLRLTDQVTLHFDLHRWDKALEIWQLQLDLEASEALKIGIPQQKVRIWQEASVDFDIAVPLGDLLSQREAKFPLEMPLTLTITTPERLHIKKKYTLEIYPLFSLEDRVRAPLLAPARIQVDRPSFGASVLDRVVAKVYSGEEAKALQVRLVADKLEGYSETVYHEGTVQEGAMVSAFPKEDVRGVVMEGIEGTGEIDMRWQQFFHASKVEPNYTHLWVERLYQKRPISTRLRPVSRFQKGASYQAEVRLVLPQKIPFLEIEDFLPGGIRVLEKTEEEVLDCVGWCPLPGVRQTQKVDRMVWTARDVPPGIYRLVYDVEAVTSGDFEIPPPVVKDAQGKVLGHGKGERMVVN